MNGNKEIYSILKFTVLCHVSSSICSPAMVLVRGRMLSEVLKDVELQGHQVCIVGLNMWTIHQECLVPVLKVCYSIYCS
jgi:hypothetical protein